MVDDQTQHDGAWRLEHFERHRPRLRAVAYRMLGSTADADDAVQEAWLRLNRSTDPINNMGGWLTTVMGRVCIDMLRARLSRREDYVGTWLPEPIVSHHDEAGPEDEVLLADAVGVALLVVLETLRPAERLAFVLHDMFAVPFDEIATMIDRTPAATRQLTSRARRQVRGAAPVPDTDLETQREVVDAFLAATRAGDFSALVKLLDPDVVFRTDSGTRVTLAPAQVTGAPAVARYTLDNGPRFVEMCQPAIVNGAAGVIVRTPAGVLAVLGLTVTRSRISTMDLILDPAKLRTVDQPPAQPDTTREPT